MHGDAGATDGDGNADGDAPNESDGDGGTTPTLGEGVAGALTDGEAVLVDDTDGDAPVESVCVAVPLTVPERLWKKREAKRGRTKKNEKDGELSEKETNSAHLGEAFGVADSDGVLLSDGVGELDGELLADAPRDRDGVGDEVLLGVPDEVDVSVGIGVNVDEGVPLPVLVTDAPELALM